MGVTVQSPLATGTTGPPLLQRAMVAVSAPKPIDGEFVAKRRLT
jgi:hypothetical protein